MEKKSEVYREPKERSMSNVKCFKYRLYPTQAQEHTLVQFAGCRRFVWNWALARKQETYTATGKSVTYNTLAAELVTLKRESSTAFLKDCHSQVLQQVLMDLEAAYKSFFEKRSRLPRFKSRKTTPHTFRIPQHVTVVGGRVSIPKIGLVNARIHRPLEGVVKSATVKQDATGAWYVTFVCHIEQANITNRTTDTPVGIDVGLTSFVTLDSGEKIDAPRFYRRAERKLKRLQRKVSRCAKGSAGRKKARIALARQYQKVSNQRNDFLHKHSTKLIQDHDTICIEDLSVKGLVRTKLAKSFQDAALGTFLRMLEYKAAWGYRQVIRVSRWFPSTKMCHACGCLHHLTLSDRHWVCTDCGASHDRDVNAARNIKQEGLRILAVGSTESQNAAGAYVRLGVPSNVL